MSKQEQDFQAAYGEALFYAHLIEDLLAMHLYECSYFHVNQYHGLSRKEIRDMKHEKRIDELLKIYREQDEKDSSITRLVTALHHLRKIRNHLSHAFMPQVGSDFHAEEGIDQIVAMLKNICYWERGWLKTLQQAHEGVLKGAIRHCFEAVIEREDPPFDARVSESKIQEHLDALREQMKG
jgi:hypothetical protein